MPEIDETVGGEELRRVKTLRRRVEPEIEQSAEVIGGEDAKDAAEEEGGGIGAPAPRHLAMPGKQKGDAAREEEKLHPVPAEDGEAMDGIGKFGIAEGEMAGDDEQDGVATQGVDIGENRVLRRARLVRHAFISPSRQASIRDKPVSPNFT